MSTGGARGAVCALFAALALWHGGNGAWIHAKAGLAQVLLERAWTRTLAGASAVRPWRWADTWPVARLSIPDKGVALIVLAGASGRNLAFGPAHLSASAAPGTQGNAVIAGHRDTHFAVLEHLVEGDVLVLESASGRSRYRVSHTAVVDAEDAAVLHDDGRAMLTLVTCFPFDAVRVGTSRRYVVTAERMQGSGRGGGAA